jgi:hypothetical protein
LVPRSGIRKDEQGDNVKPIEHNTKPASTPKTGLFALLSGLLRVKGIGAPLAVAIAVLAVLAVPASSALAAGDANQSGCPAETESSPGFRTYMPDCRAYELVTPPYAAGAVPRGVGKELPPISADGEDLASLVFGGFAEAGNLENDGLETGAIYELARTGSGWNAEALDPPASLAPRRVFDYPSADISESLWELELPQHSGEELPISPPNGVFVRNNRVVAIRRAAGDGKGSFTLLGPIAAPGHVPSLGLPGEPEFVGVEGASAELTRIVFAVPNQGKQLWPGDETPEQPPERGVAVTPQSLYEYQGGSGSEPVLVGVSNEGSVIEQAAREGREHINEAARLISHCGDRLGNRQTEGAAGSTTASGAISATLLRWRVRKPQSFTRTNCMRESMPRRRWTSPSPRLRRLGKQNALGCVAKKRSAQQGRTAGLRSIRVRPKMGRRCSSRPNSAC